MIPMKLVITGEKQWIDIVTVWAQIGHQSWVQTYFAHKLFECKLIHSWEL